MATRLRFNAPAHHKLLEGGKEIPGGEAFTVSDERALELLTNPRIDCSELGDDLSKRTRPELNELARLAGVENPAGLPNKDAVIAAINEAEAG